MIKFKKRGRQNLDWCTRQPQVKKLPIWERSFLQTMTKENTKKSMKMQVAAVSRPLASVKRICEAGHVVVFDEDGSFIFNKMTGDKSAQRGAR